MNRRQMGFRLTQRSLDWLRAQAELRGISMNDVVQELINKEMTNEASRAA